MRLTFIEVLIVVVIIGLLAAIVVPFFMHRTDTVKLPQNTATENVVYVKTPDNFGARFETVMYDGHKWVILSKFERSIAFGHHPDCSCKNIEKE